MNNKRSYYSDENNFFKNTFLITNSSIHVACAYFISLG